MSIVEITSATLDAMRGAIAADRRAMSDIPRQFDALGDQLAGAWDEHAKHGMGESDICYEPGCEAQRISDAQDVLRRRYNELEGRVESATRELEQAESDFMLTSQGVLI